MQIDIIRVLPASSCWQRFDSVMDGMRSNSAINTDELLRAVTEVSDTAGIGTELAA